MLTLFFRTVLRGEKDSDAKSAPASPDHVRHGQGRREGAALSGAPVMLLLSCLELERRGLSVAVQYVL